MSEPADTLSLWDFRNQVASIYRDVRSASSPEAAWQEWTTRRNELFASHPQSPIPVAERSVFSGLHYFPYDPSWRFIVPIDPTEPTDTHLGHSADGSSPFRSFGRIAFTEGGVKGSLDVFWLTTYGGGVFLPFRDSTNGEQTYGGGRYLLDTVKSADLGREGDAIVLDFNFAYHPSCVHNDRWSCPLAPASNALALPVEAGERLKLSP